MENAGFLGGERGRKGAAHLKRERRERAAPGVQRLAAPGRQELPRVKT